MMLDAWRLTMVSVPLLSVAILSLLIPGAEGFVRYVSHSRTQQQVMWRNEALAPTPSKCLVNGGIRRPMGAGGVGLSMKANDKKGNGPYKVIANNKKARRNFEIMEKFEAGVELLGSEVKSCRMSKINMDEGFAQAKNGQCYLHGVHIAECGNTNRFDQHEPKRPRRLLLHKREIKKLEDKIGQKGFTVVPLKVYFNDDNRLKVEIALAQGKNVRDKRDDIKDRDAKRDLHRIAKNAY